MAVDLSSEAAVQRWLHGLFLESDAMLDGFYSLDPGRRGKLIDFKESPLQISRISAMKTLPTFVLFSSVLCGILGTERGREYYWKSWLFGSMGLAAFSALAY
jgi:hypothetical protein